MGDHTPAYTAGVVLFYFVISISQVFLNKELVSRIECPGGGKFPYSVTVTAYQLLVALCMVVAAPSCGFSKYITLPRLRLSIVKELMPLSIAWLVMLSCANICLRFVQVAFYQTARSLGVPFSVLFTRLILGENTSAGAVASCALMCAGYWLASAGEINVTMQGLLFGMVSSMSGSLYNIYIKKGLKLLNQEEWHLFVYNNGMGLTMLTIYTIVSGEAQQVGSSSCLEHAPFWIVMTIAGVVGFFLNIAVVMQIKVTSPLTNQVAGLTKSVFQMSGGALFLGEVVTLLNCLGFGLSVVGSCAYAYTRYRERCARDMAAQEKPKSS